LLDRLRDDELDVRRLDLRERDVREADFRLLDFRGTFPPALRASDSPIAMACLRLVTRLPLLLRSVPFFRSCMARSTFFDAFFPYLATCPPCKLA
jgi:hypothetical protein